MPPSLHTGLCDPEESTGSESDDGSFEPGPVSSAVERPVHIGKVVGSKPTPATSLPRTIGKAVWGELATGDVIANVLAYPQLAASIAQRFWRQVDKSAGDGACWPFLGSRRSGYGRFKPISYISVSAHRMAYALGTGESPGDLHVCHRCDNPPCCNPAHFFLGTNADNVADKIAKGRQAVTRDQSGENNGAHKLSGSQVEEVRRLILSGRTNTAIAAIYGVTHQAISRIRRGRSWGAEPMQPKYASLRAARGIT